MELLSCSVKVASQPRSAPPLMLPFIWSLSVRCHPVQEATQEVDIVLIMPLLAIRLFGLSSYWLKISAYLAPRLLLGLRWSSTPLSLSTSAFYLCLPKHVRPKGTPWKVSCTLNSNCRVCFPKNPTCPTTQYLKESTEINIMLYHFSFCLAARRRCVY